MFTVHGRGTITSQELAMLFNALGLFEAYPMFIRGTVFESPKGEMNFDDFYRHLKGGPGQTALNSTSTRHNNNYHTRTITKSLDMLAKKLITFEDLSNARMSFSYYEGEAAAGVPLSAITLRKLLRLMNKGVAPSQLLTWIRKMNKPGGRIQVYEFLELLLLCRSRDDIRVEDRTLKIDLRKLPRDFYERACPRTPPMSISSDSESGSDNDRHFRPVSATQNEKEMQTAAMKPKKIELPMRSLLPRLKDPLTRIRGLNDYGLFDLKDLRKYMTPDDALATQLDEEYMRLLQHHERAAKEAREAERVENEKEEAQEVTLLDAKLELYGQIRAAVGESRANVYNARVRPAPHERLPQQARRNSYGWFQHAHGEKLRPKSTDLSLSALRRSCRINPVEDGSASDTDKIVGRRGRWRSQKDQSRDDLEKVPRRRRRIEANENENPPAETGSMNSTVSVIVDGQHQSHTLQSPFTGINTKSAAVLFRARDKDHQTWDSSASSPIAAGLTTVMEADDHKSRMLRRDSLTLLEGKRRSHGKARVQSDRSGKQQLRSARKRSPSMRTP
eukprot:Rmarinus@m.26713